MGEAVSGTSDELAGAAREARDAGARIAGDLKDQASAEVDRRKQGVADQVDDAAAAARHTAGTLRDEHQAWLADLVDRGAAELGAMAETLRGNDLHGLLSQVENFARRQPALFTGASIAAGFALARMARVAAADGAPAPRPDADLPVRPVPMQQPPAGAMYHG